MTGIWLTAVFLPVSSRFCICCRFLIGIAVFTLYPVINVVLMSFKEGYSYLSRGFDQWGLANYQTVLSDPKFSQAIGNTLKYVILVVPISTCIAVVVAYLLNQKLRFSAVSRRHISCRWSRPSLR